METRSEELFRVACRINRLLVWRLRESRMPGRQRPDFLTWKWFSRVAVEVKQFDPSPQDLKLLARQERGEILAYGGEPGRRVREAIAEGSGQLRAETGGRWPGIIVVHDNTGFDYHDQPYHILTAMFGLEAVKIAVSNLVGAPLTRLGMVFAGKRKTTPDSNRAVSAVARLYIGPASEPYLDVFHNPHTTAPLSHRRWHGRTIRHFGLGPPDGEGRREWNPY